MDAEAGDISSTISDTAAGEGYAVNTVIITAGATTGETGSTSFAWAVTRPQRAPVLGEPDDQTSAELDEISLQLTATDANGDTLIYVATGLPMGLHLDPDTGLISGTIDRTAAETNEGTYEVWVTVYDGHGNADTHDFTWTVSNTNTAPWLDNPGLRISDVDESVTFSLYAGDADSDPLTYSATGLPSGVSLNTQTGVISGAADTAGEYTVTATVSDGQDEASRTFTWNVNADPRVILNINKTEDESDDAALLGASTPLPIDVRLEGAEPGVVYQITLTLSSLEFGSADQFATLDQTQFDLTNGGTMTVLLTPLQVSPAEGDLLIQAQLENQQAPVAAKDLTVVNVTFPAHIRDENTPEGMRDRIKKSKPYKDDPGMVTMTKIDITITPVPQWTDIHLVAVGNNAATNGVFKIHNGNGGFVDDLPLKDPNYRTIGLPGEVQTVPTMDGKGGNAGNLKLKVEVGTQNKQSAGFSVAAIPVDWVEKFKEDYIIESSRGMTLHSSWSSDSGKNEDLNSVELAEVIHLVSANGVYQNTGVGDTAGYLSTTVWKSDTHWSDVDFFKAPGGRKVVSQLHVFKDQRTGSAEVPVTNSGYLIERLVFFDDKDNQWKLKISKFAAKVAIKEGKIRWQDANGRPHEIPVGDVTSEAGATDPKLGISKEYTR